MRLNANGLQIEVALDGPASGTPLLLIMGLGMQLTAWPDELVQALVGHGFRVIRFDNRDGGLSQGFDAAGRPPLGRALVRQWLHLPLPAPAYTLADMSEDARGVLDALGLPAAHVCGASMGGMIAQHLADRHPQRVRSLSLWMTSSGARHLPGPRPSVQLAMAVRPASSDEAAVVAHLEKLLRVIGSPGWPADPAAMRARMQAHVRRGWRPQGTERQLHAVMADGDRSALLARLAGHPRAVGVVHGAADPLIPPAHGRDLAARLPGARLDLVAGMGHDLPVALMPRLARHLAEVAGLAGPA